MSSSHTFHPLFIPSRPLSSSILGLRTMTVRSGTREVSGASSSFRTTPESNSRRSQTSHFFTPQLFFSVGVMLIGAYINCIAQVIVDRQASAKGIPVLPDSGFDIVTFAPQQSSYADIALYIIDGITAVRFLLDRRLRYVFIRRRLFLQGTLFLLRSLSILVTRLPNPYLGCPISPSITRWPLLVVAVLILGGQVKTCNDVMFSGHAVSMTLSMSFWLWHSSYRELIPRIGNVLPSMMCGRFLNDAMSGVSKARALSILTKVVVLSGWMMGALTVISTRFHYSLDVYIGTLLATLLFNFYYALVAIIRLFDKEYDECPPETNSTLVRFILWFEHCSHNNNTKTRNFYDDDEESI